MPVGGSKENQTKALESYSVSPSTGIVVSVLDRSGGNDKTGKSRRPNCGRSLTTGDHRHNIEILGQTRHIGLRTRERQLEGRKKRGAAPKGHQEGLGGGGGLKKKKGGLIKKKEVEISDTPMKNLLNCETSLST